MTKRKRPDRSQIDGKPVVNATESLTLAIRTSDIRHAVATAPDACAAAIACVRQFGALSARVYPSRTFIEYDKQWVRYVTAGPLRDEIVAIDGGGKFHPGIYTLMKTGNGTMATGKAHGPTPERGDKPRKRRKAVYVHTVRGRIHFGTDTLAPAVVDVTADLVPRSR